MTNARLSMTRARAFGVAGLTLGALAVLAGPANADEPAPQQAPAPSPATPPAPPAPDAAEPTPDADAAAIAALVGDLSAGGGDSVLDPDEVTFSLYGFADFSYVTQIGKKVITGSPYPTFMVGNLNVYFSTEFERRWRSLAEVRFLYAPNGSWLADNQFETNSSPRGDTSFLDGSDLNHPMRWGGIAIQRIWLEYKFDSYLTLRAGQWLTPYGIWNVDHGSPTIIGGCASSESVAPEGGCTVPMDSLALASTNAASSAAVKTWGPLPPWAGAATRTARPSGRTCCVRSIACCMARAAREMLASTSSIVSPIPSPPREKARHGRTS